MSDDVMVENRTFAEIEVGHTASLSRTLTKTELEGFAAVSGDFNPTHLNEAYARAHGLQAPVAHGMWTASLISNLLGNRLPGAGGPGQDLRFRAPSSWATRSPRRSRSRPRRRTAARSASTAAAPTRTGRRCSPASPR